MLFMVTENGNSNRTMSIDRLSREGLVETHPAPRAPFEVVALHVRRALVDCLNEQARTRVVAIRRALVVVAALEPPASAAVLAIL